MRRFLHSSLKAIPKQNKQTNKSIRPYLAAGECTFHGAEGELEGIFEDGYAAKNCSGRRCFDDGSLYIGDLHGFMPNGLGKLVSVRGDCYYQGSFLDGEPSGTGTFVKVKRNANGEEHETVVWRGSFKEGQPVVFENGKASRVTVEGWPL